MLNGIGLKIDIIPTFFLGNIDQENVFYDILEREKAFLGYKNKKFNKSKNCIFPKRLTHGIGPKMPIIPTFYFGNIGQENVFYDILDREKAFLGYKYKKAKQTKNWLRFWSKNGHFSNFFLGKIGQENVFYDILERKNAFLGYKNKKFKKWKNWHFSKGVNPWFWPKNGHYSNFFF